MTPTGETLTSTGIGPLDLFLRGGLPKGFTTVLLAPSGSGGEIFAKQFATGHPEERVVYVSTDESQDEVESTMKQAGWDRRNVDVVDMQSAFAQAMLDAQQEQMGRGRAAAGEQGRGQGGGQGGDPDGGPNPASEAPPKGRFDPRDLVEGTSSRDLLRGRRDAARPRTEAEEAREAAADRDYLGQLLRPYGRAQAPDRMVVHSIDFFLNLYPVEQVVASLTALKAANARAGGQLLLVVAKGAHGATTERRLELLSDCLIELEMTRRGTKFERYFLVKKVKNRTTGVGVSTYEIGDHGFTLETLERIV